MDFVLNESVAIEVKARRQVSEADLRGLKAIAEEASVRRSIVVAFEPRPRRIGGIEVLPWRQFLAMLWEGEIA
ncbi:MAG: hypothetical protein HY721_02075 [Planctomycetes bacterium]|nr:hypothetical protein [Planctomycetota bacterium]